MKRLLPLLLLLTACTSGAAPIGHAPPTDARPDGVVRIGITRPATVDPGNAYEPMSDLVTRTLCDPLILADPKTGALTPSLVQTWVVSDSGQRLVLRLKRGLRFSDGSALTADDVAFSLSRIASADYAGAVADRLSTIDGYAEVHGDTETDSDADRRRLRGVRVLDQQSLEITLTSRQAGFLQLLTSPLVSPVSQAAAERDPASFARQPICSGPFALEKSYLPGDSVIALRPVRRGYPDRIEFHVVADPAAAQRAGKVDLAAAGPSDTANVERSPGPLVDFLSFPTATGPLFDRPAVRRALALALDRQALVDTVYPGTRVPATGFLPPTALPTFHADACADLPVRGSVSRARQLLAGVDLSDVRVKYVVNADGRNVALAKAVAAQWKAAFGLTATVVALPYKDFLAQPGTDVSRFSWATSYPDADGSLFPLFSTDRIGRDNVSHYSSPTFDRALTRLAREATDDADRQLAYRDAEQVLCTDLPMVPLTFSLARFLVAPSLGTTSVYVDRTTGLPQVRDLYARSTP